MSALGVRSLGAITTVGADVRGSMAAILSALQMFEGLDVKGSDGEPLSGGRSPVLRRFRGADRLATLGLVALAECAEAGAPPGVPVPLIVCAPEASDLAVAPATLLKAMTADARVTVDLAQSRVFQCGRAAIGEALEAVVKLLRAGLAPACYLVGVDCLVERRRAARLVEEERVFDSLNADGFTPAEAAAALLLTPQIESVSLAGIAGFGRGIDEWTAGAGLPITGRGLAGSSSQALAMARVAAAEVTALVHDHSGAQRGAEELSAAGSRPPMGQMESVEVFAPAFSTGEIGAASGPLSLAMLAFFLSAGVLKGPALAAFLSEGSARAAAVVVPATHSRRG